MEAKILVFAFVFLVCTAYTSSAPTDLDVSDKQGNADDVPDISSMFGLFNGGFNINNIKTLVDNFKLAGTVVEDLMKVSPMLRSIVNEAAKKNIKISILQKMLEGNYPDLGDLFKLATTKTNSVKSDFISAFKNNPQYSMLDSLSGGNVLKPETLEKMFELMTGKKIQGNPFKDQVNNDKDSGNEVYSNAVALADFVYQNQHVLKAIRSIFGISGPLNTNAILQQLKKLDLSKLQESVVANGDKYTVSNPNGGQRTDPELMKLVQNLKAKQAQLRVSTKTSGNAEGEVMEFVNLGMKIFDNILTAVGSNTEKHEKTA